MLDIVYNTRAAADSRNGYKMLKFWGNESGNGDGSGWQVDHKEANSMKTNGSNKLNNHLDTDHSHPATLVESRLTICESFRYSYRATSIAYQTQKGRTGSIHHRPGMTKSPYALTSKLGHIEQDIFRRES